MKKYKNLITMLCVCVITIMICLYALKWYDVYKENKLKTAIIADYIHELKKDEMTNYLSENPLSIIYFGVTSDEDCRIFEKQLKKFVADENLMEVMVYINVNELVGDDFNSELNVLYNTKSMREKNKYFKGVPTIAVYNHTTLVDFVSGSDLTIKEVRAMLNQYDVNGK
ncbi:MAG: hypothetical protein PHI22_02495 [Bacilli bacterium]|nr:hypothetical protein [Bacilli bacterium]MDD4298803.1 hypothetical protein [Bacilli bacterium]MDD4644096.1 hypothetical protein [Bacilli bacterium]